MHFWGEDRPYRCSACDCLSFRPTPQAKIGENLEPQEKHKCEIPIEEHIKRFHDGFWPDCKETGSSANSQGNSRENDAASAPSSELLPSSPAPERGEKAERKGWEGLFGVSGGIFYQEDNSIPYSEAKSFWVSLRGKDELRELMRQLLATEYERGARNQVIMDARTAKKELAEARQSLKKEVLEWAERRSNKYTAQQTMLIKSKDHAEGLITGWNDAFSDLKQFIEKL